MRQDDLYRLLLHSMWATCYYKSLSRSAASLYTLSTEEAEALLSSPTTPTKFSNQLLQDIDVAIRHLSVSLALCNQKIVFASVDFRALTHCVALGFVFCGSGRPAAPCVVDWRLERHVVVCSFVGFPHILHYFCFHQESSKGVQEKVEGLQRFPWRASAD